MARYNQRLHRIRGNDRLAAILTVCWSQNDQADDSSASLIMDQVIEIGPPSAAEADQVTGLLHAQLLEYDLPITRSSLEASVQAVLSDSEKGFFVIARIGRECVGVAYLSFTWALEHGGRSGRLEELYVKPAFRGVSIGTQLFQYLLGECKAFGCAAVDMEIDTEHEPIRSLYERNGFKALPRQRMVKKL